MSPPLLEENPMELYTQGLSKPYYGDYTATIKKNKTGEPRGHVLVMEPTGLRS